MKLRGIIASVLLLSAFALLQAQTTQPDQAALRLRADEAFAQSNFAGALPIYEKLAVVNKDNPDALGPIMEKIRVCQRNLNLGPDGAASDDRGPRVPHTKPGNGEVLELAIKELGNFDYDADRGGNIPADVKALSGSKLRITGFMIPMDQAENITQFALVPSLFACCFGQPPTIQHTIVVNCPAGKSVSYYPDEIVVEGILNVEEKKEDDFIVSIFEMAVLSVKPAPQ